MADAAAAYAVETTAEGAIGAGVAIAKSTMPLKASWKRILTNVTLPRSSHSLSIVNGKAYVFGGEENPREPVDNNVHVFSLQQSSRDAVDYQIVTSTHVQGGEVPPSRVGHTAAVVDNRIYLFGGRGGKAMQPLEEKGRVWVYDTKTNQWTFLDPCEASSFPEPRSYHVSTSTNHPQKTEHDHGIDSVGVVDSGFDDHGTLFIHGGCSASGRLADAWGFDIASRMWAKYADAPGPARGGSSLVFIQDRLYRFGGFDGKAELGGSLDYLQFQLDTFNDKGGKGELAVVPRSGKWESIEPPEGTAMPGNRSVAGLQAVTSGQGRWYLLLFLGERDSSSSGHEAAGKFWEDVWSFQLRPEGMTGASFKDATRWLVGAKTAEGTWARVDIPESSKTDRQIERPSPRGWFASCSAGDLDPLSVVLWGGVMDDNQRAGDGWMLTIET